MTTEKSPSEELLGRLLTPRAGYSLQQQARITDHCDTYPVLDGCLRFISYVRPIEGREAVEFAQLNVFGPDSINDLLIGGSAVHDGVINPSLDSRRGTPLMRAMASGCSLSRF